MNKKMIAFVAWVIVIGLLVGVWSTQAPNGRPDIRIIRRETLDMIDGQTIYELQWALNGASQIPADFTVESERDRFESYLRTVGRVSE